MTTRRYANVWDAIEDGAVQAENMKVRSVLMAALAAHIEHETVEAMADEAERGYDVEEIARRRGGRPPMGSSASSVESVRLDPELKRDLLLRAAAEHISVSEAIRRAIGQYLRPTG